MKLIRLLVLLIVVVLGTLSGGIAASADTWGDTALANDVIDPGGLSLPSDGWFSPADVIDPGGL